MRWDGRGRHAAVLAGIGCLLFGSAALPAHAETILLDFEDYAPGWVMAGELPGGGMAASDVVNYVTFSAVSYTHLTLPTN